MYNKLISTVTAVAFMIFSSAVVGLTRSYAATINVSPTQDIQTAVNANPSGTTFVIAAGLYRMQSVTPKDGDVFLGQPGAILNGSRQLTSFARAAIILQAVKLSTERPVGYAFLDIVHVSTRKICFSITYRCSGWRPSRK